MAKDCSFDVVSEVDMQEVDNAVNQTKKEMIQRYDFKGSKAEIDLEGTEIKILADDDYKLKSVIDILQTKLAKRDVPLKVMDYGKVDSASGGLVRQTITVQKGVSKEKGKDIVAAVKGSKIKVQAQIMESQVRVSGKNRDDLQAVIQVLKEKDFGIALQFINYR